MYRIKRVDNTENETDHFILPMVGCGQQLKKSVEQQVLREQL